MNKIIDFFRDLLWMLWNHPPTAGEIFYWLLAAILYLLAATFGILIIVIMWRGILNI